MADPLPPIRSGGCPSLEAPSTQAIAERDAAFIADLAQKQAEPSTAWLDVNAGTMPAQEPDDLLWLIDTIQGVVDTPLSLDSANPKALSVAVLAVRKTPLINSISGKAERLEGILPIVAAHGCQVIALAMDGKKIAATSAKRMEVMQEEIITETRKAGVPDGSIYIDPLAMTLSTNVQSAMIAFNTQSAPCARSSPKPT